MRKFVLFPFFVFAAMTLFSQSKYLVYKETAKTGHTITYHILAGEEYAVSCSDFNPKISEKMYPLLSCYLVSRKPAGYKFLNVVDRPDEIYVGDVANSRFEKLSRKAIIERFTPDSTILAVLNEIIAEKYPDSTFVKKPTILKFTPNIGSERIGEYDCTIGKMQITESWSCKIWYTKEINYNWAHHDVFWLVPGTVIRAEYSDGLVYSLDNVSDMDMEVDDNTESAKTALRLFFGR